MKCPFERHKRSSPLIFWLFVTAGLFFILSCRENKTETGSDQTKRVAIDTKDCRKVRFMPYWAISTQFAGYYVAKDKGFYNKHGIDLDIIPFVLTASPAEYMKSGKVDFMALWLTNALEMKDAGVDIVNIAQFSSRGSLMLVTKKSSGIKSFSDMNGKKVGVWKGFEIQTEALFKKYNVNAKLVSIGSNNFLFLKDCIDLTLANWFDEYHAIINSGYDPEELTTFFFADYGMNFLEDGVYCLSEKIHKDPALCSAFVKATLEGWQWSFDHPEEAVDIVIRYAREAKTPFNKAHLRWILARYQDLMIPKGEKSIHIRLSEKDYYQVAGELKSYGLIREVKPFDSFYKLYTGLQ